MSKLESQSCLSFEHEEVGVFFDYGATETTARVRVKNNGTQVTTLIGSGWSYPLPEAIDSALSENQQYEPSLDTLFEKPVPLVPGTTTDIILGIKAAEAFTAEPRALGALALFSDNETDFTKCAVRVKLLPKIVLGPERFVIRQPGIVNIVCNVQSEAELPEITKIESENIKWEHKRLGKGKYELSGKYETPLRFLKENKQQTIKIHFAGVEHAFLHTIALVLERCAEPAIRSFTEGSLEVNQGRERIFSLEITNIGAEELMINEVVPIPPDAGMAVIPDHGLNGLRLASQGSITFPLLIQVDKSAKAGSLLETGVQIFSNSLSLPTAELRQAIEVVNYKNSATPIGFDFGTVNSCAAHLDESLGEAELLKIPVETDQNRFVEQEIFPSVMHVDSLPDESDSGFKPSLFLITRRKDTANISEAKTAFCRGESMKLRYVDGVERELSSKDCISQFFAYVLSNAEHNLNKTFRECVITVPTKYGGRTVDEMQDALARIGMKKNDVYVYDESTSAAMFYIRRGRDSSLLKQYALPEAYSLVIMDVGGGTTDVSILDVMDRDLDLSRQLEVTLRGTTGRIRFGGTHFNTRIKDGWFDDYYAACAEQGVPLVPMNEMDLETKQQLLTPEGELAEAVEVAKCRLGKNTAQPYKGIDRALQSYTFLSPEAHLAPAVSLDQYQEIHGLTQIRLDDLLGKDLHDIMAEVELMARSLAKNPLGVVLLVGQSSQLEAIRHTVTETFGENRVCVVPAEMAKSCVVQGALELHQLLRNPGGIDFKFRDLSKVLSYRLGILWSGRYEMEFKEILPIGSELPAEATLSLPENLNLGDEDLRITILANYGAKNSIKGNENILRIGTYKPVKAVPQNGASISLQLKIGVQMEFEASLILGQEIIELANEQ